MEDFYRKTPTESLTNVAKIIVPVATLEFPRNPDTFLCLRVNKQPALKGGPTGLMKAGPRR